MSQLELVPPVGFSYIRGKTLIIPPWLLLRSDEGPRAKGDGLMLETSAFLLFTVANLRFQLSC